MDTRFALKASRFSPEDRRPFSNNRKISRSVSPRLRRTRSVISLPSTETHVALSIGTHNLPSNIRSVFRRQQTRKEKPHTAIETCDRTFNKKIDIGRSNTVQNLETDYSVNFTSDVVLQTTIVPENRKT